jgi:hypothetical protein
MATKNPPTAIKHVDLRCSLNPEKALIIELRKPGLAVRNEMNVIMIKQETRLRMAEWCHLPGAAWLPGVRPAGYDAG